MTPQEFYDKCVTFDWFYEMSDDHQVWRRGCAAQSALLAHAPAGSENRKIWDAFKAHHYSGEPWGTERQPPPLRPAPAHEGDRRE